MLLKIGGSFGLSFIDFEKFKDFGLQVRRFFHQLLASKAALEEQKSKARS